MAESPQDTQPSPPPAKLPPALAAVVIPEPELFIRERDQGSVETR